MSEATTSIRRSSRHTHTEGHTEAPAEAPAVAEAHVEAPAATPIAEAPTITQEIAGLQVILPVRFLAGHILTENQAKVIDAAYQRQFKNNQDALAKSRAAGTNKTPQPDAAGLAAIYSTYEPAIGDTVRLSTLERLRQEAAWRVWVDLVTRHNSAVDEAVFQADDWNGFVPVLPKAGKRRVPLITEPTKTRLKATEEYKNVDDATLEAGLKAAKLAFAEERTVFLNRLMQVSEYAPAIQAQLDQLMAEAEAKKAKGPVAATAAVEMVDANDAF